MDDGYFIFDGFEKGVEAQESGVLDPFGPVGVGGRGATSRDSKLHVFMRSAEITEEMSAELGFTSL